MRIPPLDVPRRWSARNPLLSKPSKSHPAREGTTRDQPRFAIPTEPPRAGFPMGTSQAKPKLRGEGQVVVGSCSNCRVIYQVLDDLGMQPRLHHTRRSQSPPYVMQTNS